MHGTQGLAMIDMKPFRVGMMYRRIGHFNTNTHQNTAELWSSRTSYQISAVLSRVIPSYVTSLGQRAVTDLLRALQCNSHTSVCWACLFDRSEFIPFVPHSTPWWASQHPPVLSRFEGDFFSSGLCCDKNICVQILNQPTS